MGRQVHNPQPRTRAANGEGSVRHNAERGRYEGRVTVGIDGRGQPIRRMVTGTSERDVRRKMRDLQNAADTGLTPAPRTLTLSRFLDDWLANVLPGTVSPVTEWQYRGIVERYLKPMLGRHHVATLTPRDVAKMLRDMGAPTAQRPNGYSGTTLRLTRAVLRRALATALEEGLVPRNVAAIAKPPRTERTEGRTMTPDEARQFVASIESHPDRAVFIVALACGLRISELLGIGWDDVNLDAKSPTLRVRRSLKYLPGTGLILTDTKTAKSRRTLSLPPIVRDALAEHRRQQLEARLAAADWPEKPLGVDLVFRADNGQARDPSNFRKVLSAATAAAGLGHWHPHELRHSAASLLLAQGLPLKVVSETLGHSTITITADIYAHLLDESRTAVADAMQSMIGGGR